MRFLPLIFIPAFALIGAANNQREWVGAIAGGLVGLFFGLMFSGYMPKTVVNLIFPRVNKQ